MLMTSISELSSAILVTQRRNKFTHLSFRDQNLCVDIPHNFLDTLIANYLSKCFLSSLTWKRIPVIELCESTGKHTNDGEY
jgi:hypothetical protein